MTLEDSMTGVKTPTMATTNPREALATMLPPKRVEQQANNVVLENIRCLMCQGHHTSHKCPHLHQ